ncbi:alcohol acetyltransferase [Mycena metata]|uniref:Alcohol acetyltransferase n=1 Tax=Mycena metata TaxID=1033252 RepID=A0AAD7K526_9AGAR|nr:alcohol acetyltransferase [Mycena metata]
MSTQRLRRLGGLERYLATHHFLGLETCIVTSARYTSPENTPLTEAVLFPALKALIKTHAPLGIRLEGRPDSVDVAFARLATVDLSRVVEFSETTDLQGALEKQLARPFEDTRTDLPLWRVEVLPDNTILFAVHHAIADGLSTAAFHRALVQALQTSSRTPCSPSVLVPDLPLLLAIEDITNIRLSMSTTLGLIWDALPPKRWKKAHSAWTGHRVPSQLLLQTRVRLLQFEPSSATKFADTCRAHGATVTSTLYILAVCTLARLLLNETPRDAPVYKTTPVDLPISLRGLANTPPDVLCNHVSSCRTFPPLNPEFSWSRAAAFAAELKGVQKNRAREGLGLIRWIAGNLPGFMMGLLGRKRMYGLIISNLGRVDVQVPELPTDTDVGGKWELDEMFFVHSDTFTGPALGMNIVGDPTGRLNICLRWGEQSVDVAFVEAFISTFRDIFDGLLA